MTIFKRKPRLTLSPFNKNTPPKTLPSIQASFFYVPELMVSLWRQLAKSQGALSINLPLKCFSWVLIGIMLFALSCKPEEKQQKLNIATAANMQFAMEELTQAFTKQSGIKTELILGSSGTLTAQIMAGAPYDVFVSADVQYPLYLHEQGYGYKAPDTYGYGQLVLWTCKEGISPSLPNLRQESVSHIALANPDLAPYGRAAKEILIQEGLYDSISQKLVYGESIAQTNQFIRTGAAEIGFTALSVVLSPKIKGTGKWSLLPAEKYSPIAQGILVLNLEETSLKNALKFHTFLKSENGQRVLEKYGYLPSDE
jgi:molybdate transport system substrate-binding protein